MSKNIRITGAGAGTGKTHQLCEIVSDALARDANDVNGNCRPGGFIATTFTRKAAAELTERVRKRLLERGLDDAALRVEEALVGTVHSVCTRIVRRFAFEAGISPSLRVMDESIEKAMLGCAVEECFSPSDIGRMEVLARKLGQIDQRKFESNWKNQVRDLIASARSNAIDPGALDGMARRSLDELLAYFSKPTADDLEAALSKEIENAVSMIALRDDKTKITATCVEEMQKAQRSLRQGELPWSDWCKLVKLSPGKKSWPDVVAVRQAASRVDEHPGLCEDIREYSEKIHQLACNALAIYQERKKARGMLDYADLEVLALELLELPQVCDCLRAEYDLLVVDEFQDTSPIQLALFLRLAELVKQTHWVGDTKQSIYGFRGCDPLLMEAAEKKFRGGGEAHVLGVSRRHRPELVEFFNSLFPAVFAKSKGIRPDEVKLTAHRKGHPSLPPAIELWSVSSARTLKNGSAAAINPAEFVSCVAEGIRDLMDSGMTVGDKARQTDQMEFPRPLRHGDIAVLCRTNDNASAVATSLQTIGIPAARRTAGLMAAPEAVLTLACLRWLADEGDSVAVAEVLSLESGLGIEQWLEERIEWVRSDPTGQWGLDHSTLLKSLQPLRNSVRRLSPAELLDAVIARGDLAGIVSRWSARSAPQRRANLEALRGIAAEYENNCLSASVAASHAGLIAWCGDLATAKEDLSAFDETQDAVHVLTWHGSKGLEWPVVICLGLPKEPRERIWNKPLEVSPDDFNPDKPLEGRWLRFWPYPFGAQQKDVPLNDKVAETMVGREAVAQAAFEQARLHYVAMTRARDVLVFPLDGKNAPWLPEGVECPVFQLPKQGVTEDVVNGIRRRIRYIKPGAEETPPASAAAQWFPPPLAPVEFPPAEIIPSSLEPLADVPVGSPVDFGTRVNLPPGQNDASIGDAFHAILAAYLIDPEIVDFHCKIGAILEAHGLHADANAIAISVIAFHGFLTEHFKPSQILVEVPFTHHTPLGQRITGFIDLVLLTNEGAVLIDHKTYPGTGLEERARTYSGQLAAYRAALEAAGHPVSSIWIHWCNQGKLQPMGDGLDK